MPPCLTLSIIRYGSRVKWSNPEKGVPPSPTPQCSSCRKGSFRVALDYDCQLYFTVETVGAINFHIMKQQSHFVFVLCYDFRHGPVKLFQFELIKHKLLN